MWFLCVVIIRHNPTGSTGDLIYSRILPKILLTLRAHVWRGDPHVHQAAVLVQVHHGLWSHGFSRVVPAAVRVVDHIPFRLEVHHRGNAQLLLQLEGHMLQLARAAAQPDPGEDPEGGAGSTGGLRRSAWRSVEDAVRRTAETLGCVVMDPRTECRLKVQEG